ncbi:MAG: hypothetical protein KAU14_01960 [Thermoplasmata archaeon]|nr:hypothetical protein [Thermoplasmata archaeon]
MLDADVAVYALHKPKDKKLQAEHKKASKIIESFLGDKNELFLTSMTLIETASVLSKILREDVAREGVEKLASMAKEIYPLSIDRDLYLIYSTTSTIYFQKCLENAFKISKLKKEPNNSNIPGFKDKYTDVKIGGMDIFVLTYAQIKKALLITNDWSLFYAASKCNVNAHWLKHLSNEDVERISEGREAQA